MDPLALILSLPALSLLLFLVLPSRWANARTGQVRRVVTALAGLQLVVAAVAAVAHVGLGHAAHRLVLIDWGSQASFNPSVYYDGASSLMLLLVSFVGWVICKFSHRYLDGDAQQGRYFRWTAATIGAVSLMAISGNLLMFALAWVMTSFGLHHLLLHFPDRPAAQRGGMDQVRDQPRGRRRAHLGPDSDVRQVQDTRLRGAVCRLATEWCRWNRVGNSTRCDRLVVHRSGDPQVGTVPFSLMAATDDGDPNAGFGLDACRNRQCRRIPVDSDEPPGRACSLGADHARHRRCGDRGIRWGRDDDTVQRQAGSGLLHDRPNGIHDAAVRAGGVHCRDAPPARPLALQGPLISQ